MLDEEEVFTGIEQWLKARRDEFEDPENVQQPYITIDTLLDEIREGKSMGVFPWDFNG